MGERSCARAASSPSLATGQPVHNFFRIMVSWWMGGLSCSPLPPLLSPISSPPPFGLSQAPWASSCPRESQSNDLLTLSHTHSLPPSLLPSPRFITPLSPSLPHLSASPWRHGLPAVAGRGRRRGGAQVQDGRRAQRGQPEGECEGSGCRSEEGLWFVACGPGIGFCLQEEGDSSHAGPIPVNVLLLPSVSLLRLFEGA